MYKIALSLALVLAICGSAAAQSASSRTSGKASGNTSATATKGDKSLNLAGATNIAAELQNSLNVEKANVGDEVILKTKKSIKQNGEIVVDKGARLIGKVTEVQEKTKGVAQSKIGMVFHTLQQGGQSIPINATITSVFRAAANANAGMGDDIFASGSGSGSARSTTTASSSGGGGLLGGVTNTVGGVLNTTTNTVGSVAGTATNTVGSTVNDVGTMAGGTVNATTGVVSGTNIRGLTISQSGNASASGGSTLTLNGGNLNLQKGTTFHVTVSESTNASTSQNRRTKN